VSEQDLGVLVALREAASRLGVTATAVKHWIRAGRLRGRRFAGELYVPAVDIDALMREHNPEIARVS
jgi:excisionase family DNA binding protein